MEDNIYETLLTQKYHEDDLKHFLYNTCTNSSGYHFVRILKAYRSPINENSTEAEKLFTNHPLIKEFSLRFYLPKEALSLKGVTEDPKIKNVVIIVNGLNEILPDHFKFYDFLGTRFAEKGIASVLLSTPYHLHRVQRDYNKETQQSKIIIPSKKFIEPLDFYLHYKITQSEIIDLAKKIKHAHKISDPYDLKFYENHFGQDVKITVLGYSLGGLISLGTLLFMCSENSDERLIDSCILYNSAPRLGNATTTDIGITDEDWNILWRKFSDPSTDEIFAKHNNGNSLSSSFFKDLYIGLRSTHLDHSPTKRLIYENSKKLLLVMSGADDIIDTKAWDDYLAFNQGKRQKTVINEFIFAGVGHSPMKEAQGAEVLPRVVEVMADHILNNQQTHWQEQDILSQMYSLITPTSYFQRVLNNEEKSYEQESFDRGSLTNLLCEFENDENKADDFIRLYYLSKIYYPKFSLLIKDIKKKFSKDKIH